MMAAIGALVQHNQVIAHHFGSNELAVGFFIFPAAGAQAPFNITLGCLCGVFF